MDIIEKYGEVEELLQITEPATIKIVSIDTSQEFIDNDNVDCF